MPMGPPAVLTPGDREAKAFGSVTSRFASLGIAVNTECACYGLALTKTNEPLRVTMDAMKIATILLLAISVLISGLIGLADPAAAQRKRVYGYAPYAYVPYGYGYVGPPPYGTYSNGFSPFPYSDGYGAYARSSFGVVPRGYGFYGYGPDPDSASGYGPYFGTNPWWRAMGRFGMDGRPQ